VTGSGLERLGGITRLQSLLGRADQVIE